MGAGAAAFPPDIQDITGRSFNELDVDGNIPRYWAEHTATVVFGATTFANKQDLVDFWIDRWSDTPARPVYRQGMSWIYKRDLSDRLPQIVLPVLVTHGEEETAYPMKWVLPMIEALPNVTLARIPEAGHFANLENPVAVNTCASSFLTQLIPKQK